MTIGAIATTRLSTAPVSQVVHPRLLAPIVMKLSIFLGLFTHFSHLETKSWVASIALTAALTIGSLTGHWSALVSFFLFRSMKVLQVKAMTASSSRFFCLGSPGKVQYWLGTWKSTAVTALVPAAMAEPSRMFCSLSFLVVGGSSPSVMNRVACSRVSSRLSGMKMRRSCSQ